MRRFLLLLVVACGQPAVPADVRAPGYGPRLPPPPVMDPARPGAAFLTSVALQLQPGWGQFLDDCRIRLPASHALNRMTLTAIAAITLDRRGAVVGVELVEASGNADFDRAVRDAIAEVGALPAPPDDVLADDDRVHLRWRFARDRRQAGPATATIETHDLALAPTVARMLAAGQLARAARRCGRARAGDERTRAVAAVMTAALREALTGVDGSVQRAAVDAIGAAHATELAPEVRAVLEGSSDVELRAAATRAAAALGDTAAGEPLLRQLAADLPAQRRIALAEVEALAKLGRANEAAAVIATLLPASTHAPNPIALEASAFVPLGALVPRITGWLGRGDAITRTAACAALAGETSAAALHALAKGLDDADASVRASCAAAVTLVPVTPESALAPLAARLVALQHDRDGGVRASAVFAVAAVDPARLANARDDLSPEVRAAYWRALAIQRRGQAGTIDGATGGPVAPSIDARAGLADPVAAVRLAAVAVTDADELLRHLAESDEAPEVRTAALVQLARRAGRAATEEPFLAALAAAPRASGDRVRISRAWLLAR